jgi:chitin disaccharide deacetylase
LRHLIINADGYGFTEGVTRAIDECIEFGTVRSVSTNVNFPWAEAIGGLVERHPWISVGCHLNPVVGRPVLPAAEVPTLVNEAGEFHYHSFARRVQTGRIRRDELRRELMAQVERTRTLAGNSFTHVDFHKGLHRLPRLYPLFLEVAIASGTGRIRTHRYSYVMLPSHRPPPLCIASVAKLPVRASKYGYNRLLRQIALRRGLAMPDTWLVLKGFSPQRDVLTGHLLAEAVRGTPAGHHELVMHPGYVDDELRRWSTYLEPREDELRALTDPLVKRALDAGGVRLSGYRDIPAAGPCAE